MQGFNQKNFVEIIKNPLLCGNRSKEAEAEVFGT
jgi:hypothetical protein